MKPIGKEIKKIMGEHPKARECRAFNSLAENWESITGFAAGKTKPLKIQGNVLTVGVSDGATCQALSMERSKIQRSINGRVGRGVIQKIRFLVHDGIDARPGESEKRPAEAHDDRHGPSSPVMDYDKALEIVDSVYRDDLEASGKRVRDDELRNKIVGIQRRLMARNLHLFGDPYYYEGEAL